MGGICLGRLLRTLRLGAVGALVAATACGQADRKVDSAQSVSRKLLTLVHRQLLGWNGNRRWGVRSSLLTLPRAIRV